MMGIRKIFLCLFITSISFPALAGRVLPVNAPTASAGNSNNDNTTISSNTTAASSSLGMSFNQVEQAAERGDPDAQYALGYMYYYGQGVPKDDVTAKVWIEKAAAQGQPQAQKALDLINRTNYPDQSKMAIRKPADTARATGAVNMPNTIAAAQSAGESDATAAATAAANTVPTENDSALAITPDQSTGSTAIIPSHAAKNHKNHNKLTKTAAKPEYSSREKRLLNSPSHYYTVQLLGAFRKNDVIKVMNHYRLGSKATYYKTEYEGKPWYVLVYGTYKNDHEAEAAIAKLPAGVRKLEPWVKSLASVQAGIRKAENK